MDCIRKSWLYRNPICPNSTGGLKDKLYALSDACLNIYKTYRNYSNMRNLSSEAYQVLGKNLSKTDPFRLEKYFILGLFESTFDLARQRMIAIEAEYIPAKEIARGATNGFIMYGDDSSHLFSIRDYLRCENANHLEFFINNLLRFRNYDKSC